MNNLNQKNILIIGRNSCQYDYFSTRGYIVNNIDTYDIDDIINNYQIIIVNDFFEHLTKSFFGSKLVIVISNDYQTISNLIMTGYKNYVIRDDMNNYIEIINSIILSFLNEADEVFSEDYLLKVSIRNAPILLSCVDNNGIVKMVKGKSLTNLKLTETDLLNKPLFSVFSSEKLKDKYNRLNSGKSFKGIIELKGLPFESWAVPLKDKTGNQVGSVSLCTELSTLIKTEQQLEDSQNKYKLLIENAPIGILTADKNGNILDANNVLIKILGSPSIEETKKINLLYSSYIIDSGFSKDFKQCIEEKKVIVSEMPYRSKWSKEAYIRYHLSCIYDNKKEVIGVQALIEDITERIRAQHKLESSLREKELLLKEIHHRVKNNLQIISSLLNLQSTYIKDKKNLEIFRESQNRVKSMALIHEELYKSSDLSKIDFKKYIENLINHLYQSYKFNSKILEFIIISDKIFLDIETAIPLGLIINELVSNSVKYAFKDKDHGIIEIKLTLNEDIFELTVSDNGIGFPEGFKFEKQKTLGLQLVLSLIEQIEGQFITESNNGAKFIITFQELKYRERY